MQHKTSKTQTKTLGPISSDFIKTLTISGKDIFTLEDACQIYQSERQEATHFLKGLVNRGLLARIKSGLFLILKTGQEDTQLSNWPIIARTLAGATPIISLITVRCAYTA